MSEEKAFTEDDVANDFVDAIDTMIGENLGHRGRLDDYDWWAGPEDGDNDGAWPFTVVRDDREFEVDIDVRVVELTPERKARREADMRELKARMSQSLRLYQKAAQERHDAGRRS